ncbi:unnamed protein product, partial [Cochlearia groenlandica]
MALSPKALDDLKKLIATQVAEAMAQLLPQQISQQLTLEREKQARKAKEVSSESESGHTPTPSEAIRLAKGKGPAGSSRMQAIRHVFPRDNTEKETRLPRDRADPFRPAPFAPRRATHFDHSRRPETVGDHRIHIHSDEEYYELGTSDRSHRSRRRDREVRDPVRQQLRHIKAKFPPFQ